MKIAIFEKFRISTEIIMTEILVNILGLAVSAVLYFGSSSFRVSRRPGVPSAAFFPTIIAVILLVLGVYNLIVIFMKRKKGEKSAETVKMSKMRLMQFFGVLALLVLYALLWQYHLGHFVLNSAVVFTCICWLMSDETEWWKTLIYCTALSLFIFLLFSQLLRVRIW